jgi:dTDP-4-amino-4,6-dideoxygalactose transaminase
MSPARSNKGTPAIEGGKPVRAERLPFYRTPLDESDVAAVVEALRSGWLTAGPRTEEFERRVCDYLGVANAVAVSSCSDAMFLSLAALGVGEGDEVVTSCNTFASTVTAVIHNGATPVLADIEPETFGIDAASVEKVLTPRTKAVLPVHFGGQACAIEDIVELARDRDIAVVEDAAHSFGARVSGSPIGSLGDATAFSFYATKNLTTAEGGAITTGDDALAARLRLLSYHGMSRDSWSRYSDRGSWYYEVELPGYKRNMSDLQAALGVSQLARIDALLERRRTVAAMLIDGIGEHECFELPSERPGNWHTWHLFVLRLRLDRLRIDRDAFIQALAAEGVSSSVHFIPIYRHPFFSSYLTDGASFPVCDDYYSRCISLPLFPDMTEGDVEDVVTALHKIAAWYRAD